MDAFKTNNYCIYKFVLKTCRRCGVSINFTITEKKKTSFIKKKKIATAECRTRSASAEIQLAPH